MGLDAAKLWTVPGFEDIELLRAAYTDRVFPRHFHDTYVIQIVEKGVNGLYCAGKTWKVPAGSLLVIHPGDVHTGYSVGSKELHYRCIYPTIDLMRQISGGPPPHFDQNVINDHPLAALYLRIHQMLEQGLDALASQSLMLEFLSHLVATHGRQNAALRLSPRESTAVRTAREYMREHFAENISLGFLAQLTGFSAFYFLRAFRKETGMPPAEFLRNLRLDRARDLLRRGIAIPDIAYQTGFFDQSHLTRHFKRFYSITPGYYRAISSKTASLMTR